jgi:hypothetical protein
MSKAECRRIPHVPARGVDEPRKLRILPRAEMHRIAADEDPALQVTAFLECSPPDH